MDETKQIKLAWLCVYCGGQYYGPEDETPASRDAALQQHVEQCPKHPLAAAKDEIRKLEEEIEQCPKHPLAAAKDEIRKLEEEIERCPATSYHAPE